MTVLGTDHLSKNFLGVQAITDLTLFFAPGQCTGVIGPNGCGKSTLMNVLTGLSSVSGGVVLLSGRRLTRVKPYRILKYGLTRTFQDGRLIEQMSVLDNVMLAMAERRPIRSLFEFRNKDKQARAEEMLRRVGLWDKKDMLAGGLSYGQRKLLEVTRAMATGATTFLFDEPFSGLFPEAIATIISLLETLKKSGCTIILIEHDMALIEQLCDHVIVMNAGTHLAAGSPAEMLHHPDVLEAYLGS